VHGAYLDGQRAATAVAAAFVPSTRSATSTSTRAAVATATGTAMTSASLAPSTSLTQTPTPSASPRTNDRSLQLAFGSTRFNQTFARRSDATVVSVGAQQAPFMDAFGTLVTTAVMVKTPANPADYPQLVYRPSRLDLLMFTPDPQPGRLGISDFCVTLSSDDGSDEHNPGVQVRLACCIHSTDWTLATYLRLAAFNALPHEPSDKPSGASGEPRIVVSHRHVYGRMAPTVRGYVLLGRSHALQPARIDHSEWASIQWSSVGQRRQSKSPSKFHLVGPNVVHCPTNLICALRWRLNVWCKHRRRCQQEQECVGVGKFQRS